MANRVIGTLAATWFLAGLAYQANANDRSAPGVVITKQEARVASPIPALVVKADLDIGDTFEKGDLLVEFDCRIISAEHKASQAEANAAYAQYLTNKELNEYGALGKSELAASRAQANAASATAQSLDVRTQYCKLTAPFSGRVASRNINSYEVAVEGAELYHIVDHTDLAVQVIVPSEWLRWLKKGGAFSYHVDETAEALEGAVSQIGAIVDPVSRTILVEGRLVDPPQNILPGMSGTAAFQVE